MENKPIRYEDREGVKGGIFLVEEFRPIRDLDQAKETYNNLVENKNQYIIDINTLEDKIILIREQLDNVEEEISTFNNIFIEQEEETIIEQEEVQEE